MIDSNKIYFSHINKCFIRTPMLPLNNLNNVGRISLTSKDEIINEIKIIMEIVEVKNALLLSYNEFYTEVQKCMDNKLNQKADIQTLLNIYLSLYKFVSRISYRCTPYGLFAGIAYAEISKNKVDLVIDKEKRVYDVQPLIYDYANFVMNLSLEFYLNNHIKFYTNPSLYVIKDKVFYIEKDFNVSGNSSLINVSKTTILNKIIRNCRKGNTLINIVNLIRDQNNTFTEEQILQYLKQLIDSQILISELFPNPNEDSLSTMIISKLYKYKNCKEIQLYYESIQFLEKSKEHIKLFDILDFKQRFPSTNILVDTRITSKVLTIPEQLINSISEQCFTIYSKIRKRNAPLLETFINKYNSRYEFAEISLLEALDPNFGIGYAESTTGNSEYQPLRIGINRNFSTGTQNTNDPIQGLVKKIFHNFLYKQNNIIDIESELESLPDLSFNNKPLNESGYIFGKIKSDKKLDNFTFIPDQIFSSQATKLIKRFSCLGSDIEKTIAQLYEEEQKSNSNAILAEVVNIPNRKFANLVLSKVNRDYEILYYTNYSSKSQNIKLDDLLIKIVEGKVRLISRSLNKEIIPVISHTYDTYLDDPIYKFLSDVANQYIGGGNFWHWGEYETWEHLPRIVYKNIILSRECWYIQKAENNFNDIEDVNVFINNLLIDKKIPTKVVMVHKLHADNELRLDLSFITSKLILAKEINKGNIFLLEDVLSDNEFITDRDQFYNTEIVIPYINNRPKFQHLRATNKNNDNRIFFPANEWLFVKIYTGSKNAEKILSTIILPYCKKLLNKQTIDKWFFIKYEDPDYHIRVRFHRSHQCTDENWNSILTGLTSKLNSKLGTNFSYKIAVDTYIREIERYGAIPLKFSEDFFYQDSIAISKFVKDLYGNEGEHYRYKFAFLNVDELLNCFRYSLQEKRNILENLKIDFFNEFKVYFEEEKYLKRFLDSRYRELRLEISEILNPKSEIFSEIYPYLKERKKFLSNNINNYIENRDSLIYSYIHMTLNRLFLVNHREQELVVYYLLSKHYESQLARLKYERNKE